MTNPMYPRNVIAMIISNFKRNQYSYNEDITNEQKINRSINKESAKFSKN